MIQHHIDERNTKLEDILYIYMYHTFSASSGLESTPQRIVSHPDFRMVVLANRPGFPFLGNDFFGAMGMY